MTAGHPDWREEDGALVRDLRFADWAGALAFVNRVGAVAEELDHHPDVLLHDFREVRLRLWTHTTGGVTDADHRLAARIDAVVSG